MALSEYMRARQERECFGTAAPVEKKKPVPIAKRSEKMKDQLKEYNKIKKEMLEESNLCEMQVRGVCAKIATGLQHKKRRGANLLNKKYLIRSCDPCNLWAEENPIEALEMGIAVSVHKIEA